MASESKTSSQPGIRFLFANTSSKFVSREVDASATGAELKAVVLEWACDGEGRFPLTSPSQFRLLCMGKAVGDDVKLKGAPMGWCLCFLAPLTVFVHAAQRSTFPLCGALSQCT